MMIDAMHDLRSKKSLPNYQTIRAAFLEGASSTLGQALNARITSKLQ